MTPPSLSSWKSKGQYAEVLGQKIFYIDEGKHSETLVISHGFPTSSYDYYAVLPELTKHFRVIIHDHLGFGFSGRPLDYSYSLIEQGDIMIRFWEQLGLEEVHILGHDYGTSVVTEVVARYNMGTFPLEIKSLTIGNGSMLIEMAHLQWTQKLLRHPKWGPVMMRFTTRKLWHHSLGRLWHDKSAINKEEFDVLWDIAWEDDNHYQTFPVVSRYLHDRVKFWNRWLKYGLYQTHLHINILWADKDPVAVVDMAHELSRNIPNHSLHLIENVGHYPMLESPQKYVDGLIKLISNSGSYSASKN